MTDISDRRKVQTVETYFISRRADVRQDIVPPDSRYFISAATTSKLSYNRSLFSLLSRVLFVLSDSSKFRIIHPVCAELRREKLNKLPKSIFVPS